MKIQDDAKWKDAAKSLVMKIIQLILLENGLEAYTKPELAEKIDCIKSDSRDYAMWLLTRGKFGCRNDEFLTWLINEYGKIVQETRQPLTWHQFDISTSNPTDLSDEGFGEFLKSPIDLTPKICTDF